jgi:hypothetical protein
MERDPNAPDPNPNEVGNPRPVASDEKWHREAEVDEWVFAAWMPDASAGVISGYRIIHGEAWYWAAAVQEGYPVLHLIESGIALRSDPLLVKAHGLWAEHICLDPLRQWSIGNETFAVALTDPAEALERGYGTPTPIGCDLEWYATELPEPISGTPSGFVQEGVMHGLVEVIGMPSIHFTEAPARRWRRWGAAPMRPVDLPLARAHSGLRAVFAYPDGNVADLVLTAAGWHQRRAVRSG